MMKKLKIWWLLSNLQGRLSKSQTDDLVLLSVGFAESVLPIYEKQYPGDSRISECLQATRGFIAGIISREDLNAAADAAARAGAYAADAARAGEKQINQLMDLLLKWESQK